MCQYCIQAFYEKRLEKDFPDVVVKKRKVKKIKYQTFTLRGYDDDFPSTLFAGWVTVKTFKARHLAHAKSIGKKVAKKLRWKVWKVHKNRTKR